MKCEMNSRGDIRITPENSVERYALQAWCTGKARGDIAGCFVVDLTPPPMPPTCPADPKYIKEF